MRTTHNASRYETPSEGSATTSSPAISVDKHAKPVLEIFTDEMAY